MYNLLKIGHHDHSGRYRGHEHTSYFPLLILLLLVSLILLKGTLTVQAQQTMPPPPGPAASSIGLTGAVPEDPPDSAAVITSPNNQQRFSESPVTVTGTCPENSLVEILKNNIFGGSALCSDEGTFSLDVDLLIGENDLVARVYNSLNQPGPNSDPVTVFYDALPPQEAPQTPLSFNDAQLIINTDAIYRGTFPDEELTMPIEVIGGTAPYAVEVQWGDNERDTIPRDNNQPFTATHVYKRAGTHRISLQATDAEGRVAFLTVVAVINGQPPEVTVGAGTGDSGSSLSSVLNQIYVLWPLMAAAFATVLSFWLGEQREKHILLSHGKLANT